MDTTAAAAAINNSFPLFCNELIKSAHFFCQQVLGIIMLHVSLCKKLAFPALIIFMNELKTQQFLCAVF